MKKNQLIIGGSILCVILLFFVLIYRSSGGKSYEGDSQISIRVESGITLPKVYLDSLLTLVDLYQNDGVEFTQSAVSVFSSAVDSQSIECPISGMNQFRSKFSGGFYTFTARQEDIRTMQLNPAQFVSAFSKTCPLPDQNASLLVHCDSDSSGFKAAWSVNTIKSLVAQLLKTSRYVKIYFTTGAGKVNIQTPQGDTPGGYVGNGGGENGGNGGEDVGGNDGGDGAGSCTSESVNAQINLETGLPNVFSWNEQEGFTYDFSLTCLRGDRETALSVNRSNVIGGKVEVEASWAQSSEKEYLATLTVKCNGKVVKVVKSTVQIRCA
jgi:hypothetical protein